LATRKSDWVIYTKDNCSFCVKAKQLLQATGIEYVEKNLKDEGVRDELIARYPEAKTVPQIFVGPRHIGGYDDLCFWHETEYSNYGH